MGPGRRRADQPDAGAVGVEVDLVLGRVKLVDILAPEKLGGTVRPLRHGKLPGRGQGGPAVHGDCRRRKVAAAATGRCCCAEDVAGAQGRVFGGEGDEAEGVAVDAGSLTLPADSAAILVA